MRRVAGLTLALALAACGTPDPKPVNVPTLETKDLTSRERAEFEAFMTELYAPCSDVAVPLSQCISEKRACARCVPAARFVLKRVREGMSRPQIEEAYKQRFDAADAKSIDLAGSPSEGPEGAPVTVVEFADFECPACRRFAPVLAGAFEKHRTTMRVVYKFLPLRRAHLHAEQAARAGFAAFAQGKFWEMDKMLFEHQDHLEQADLEGYAHALGLDVARFKVDAASQAATDRIAKDEKLADQLAVQSTPTVFVNGRTFDTVKGDLDEWVATETAVGD